MSRQNKVNPGMYTQRGRLAQDDAARELAKQRVIGSEHTWQPVQRDQQPMPASTAGGTDAAAADDEPVETPDEKPAAKAKTTAKGRITAKAKAKAPRLVRRSAKREGGAARKAVLARGAGKGSALLAAGRKKRKTATTAKRKR